MFSASITRRLYGSGRIPIYTCAILLLVIVLAHMAQSQIAEKLTQNPCSSRTSCRDCIQTKSCAWCSQPDYGDRPRCFSPSLTPYGGCAEEFTTNPDNIQVTLVNETLTRAGAAARADGHQLISGGSYEASGHRESYGSSSYSGQSYNRERQSSMSTGRKGYSQNVQYGSYSSSGRIVQIAPQRVSLKLRINEEHRLDIRYSQAEDYPVDLYYLMDLSKSMEDDKEKLSKLGDLLSDTMRNITSNFRLGFGSYVDKVLMPYVSTVPKN